MVLICCQQIPPVRLSEKRLKRPGIEPPIVILTLSNE